MLATETLTGIDLLISADNPPNTARRAALARFAAENNIARIGWQAKRGTPEPIVLLRPPQVRFGAVVVDLRAQRLRIGAADRAAMKLAIGQTRAMRQQISKADRTSGALGRVEWSFRIEQDAHARQLRRADRDWIVERESSFVEQHQRRDCRDGLGHRRDPEDRVALHWESTN